MLLGFGIPVSGAWATAEHVDEIVTTAEELGYHSLWAFQRLLSPLGDDGAPALEPQYRRVMDPLGVLAYVAGRTRAPRLGVAVLNAPYYSPVLLAKSLATLDIVSRGRLDVGLGLGWLRQEFEAVGVAFGRRGARIEDFLAALDAVWGDDVSDYTGEFYRVPRSRIEPKPLQRPRPPVLLGGSAQAALRRAGRLADGWVSSSRADPASLDRSIAVVRAEATRAGRDPDSLRFVCRAVAKVRPGERGPMTGSLDDIGRDLARLTTAGVTQAFIDLNFDPAVSSPDVDPDRAMEHARTVIRGLAPAP